MERYQPPRLFSVVFNFLLFFFPPINFNSLSMFPVLFLVSRESMSTLIQGCTVPDEIIV